MAEPGSSNGGDVWKRQCVYLIAFSLCTTGATFESSLTCCHLADWMETSRSNLSI